MLQPKSRKNKHGAALKTVEQGIHKVNVFAPFTGILTGKQKYENELVKDGDVLAGLINKNSIIFIANVPAESISKINVGQDVNINFPSIPGKTFSGKVKRIEPGVQLQNQKIPVQIDFTNLTGVLSDSLYGEASIIVDKHNNVLTVPEKAVIRNDQTNEYSVTIVNPDNIAYKVKVNVGLKKDSIQEIQSNKIKEGMTVVVQGNYGLPDSTKVKIQK